MESTIKGLIPRGGRLSVSARDERVHLETVYGEFRGPIRSGRGLVEREREGGDSPQMILIDV